MMNFLKPLFFSAIVILFAFNVIGQEAATEYVRGEDKEADAQYDIQTGLAGLKEATKDPTLLAQLIQDMQDPEMMAAAKEMMNGKEFKDNMKKLENSKEFKDALNTAKKSMDDPATQARVEAQLEHMIQRGQDTLKKNAEDTMKESFRAMEDPEVMAEAKKLMQDPVTLRELAKLAKSPQFKNYIEAVSTRRQMKTGME